MQLRNEDANDIEDEQSNIQIIKLKTTTTGIWKRTYIRDI